MLARERRVLGLNFLFGVFLVFISLTQTEVSTLLLLSICAALILSAIFLGNKREDKRTIWAQRFKIYKEHPKLAWAANVFIILLPISAGLLSFFVFDFLWKNSFHLTLGMFCVGAFVIHLIVSPHMIKQDLVTFD